jgi:hypothetical protein
LDKSRPVKYFDGIIADAQRASEGRVLDAEEMKWFVKALYQVFWFYPSLVSFQQEEQGDDRIRVTYHFRHDDFSQKRPDYFLFQLASHIYEKSFP